MGEPSGKGADESSGNGASSSNGSSGNGSSGNGSSNEAAKEAFFDNVAKRTPVGAGSKPADGPASDGGSEAFFDNVAKRTPISVEAKSSNGSGSGGQQQQQQQTPVSAAAKSQVSVKSRESPAGRPWSPGGPNAGFFGNASPEPISVPVKQKQSAFGSPSGSPTASSSSKGQLWLVVTVTKWIGESFSVCQCCKKSL